MQADHLDRKRRFEFADLPRKFKDECERLGLFQTKMPRFSQLFFHEFSDAETFTRSGQTTAPGSATPIRAARAYLKSRKRLESSCGISDIWYRYVELNAGIFVENPPKPSDFPSLASAYHRLDEDQIRTKERMFGWEAFRFLRSETPKKTPAEGTLPGSTILVPSSSPLARAAAHTIPQAKRDLTGKKLSKVKDRTVVDPKRSAGRPAAGGFSGHHAKTASGIEPGKQSRSVGPGKQSRGAEPGKQSHDVDSWSWAPTSASFQKDVGSFLEQADAVKIGKKREREHASDGRLFWRFRHSLRAETTLADDEIIMIRPTKLQKQQALDQIKKRRKAGNRVGSTS